MQFRLQFLFKMDLKGVFFHWENKQTNKKKSFNINRAALATQTILSYKSNDI